MSTTQDYPQNVPSAKQGEAVSVAAPGLVGVGGTLSPEAEATCDWLENDWDSFADALFPVGASK